MLCDPVVADPQRVAVHGFPRRHAKDLGHPGGMQEEQAALEEGEVGAGQELAEGKPLSSFQQQSGMHGAAGERRPRDC